MKLSNLFNKTKKNNTTASVQKLEKNQLIHRQRKEPSLKVEFLLKQIRKNK
jgi:inosine/xanthosine triphosphate pyrophosphatase family protein